MQVWQKNTSNKHHKRRNFRDSLVMKKEWLKTAACDWLQALFHDFYSSARRLKPDQFWENTLNKMAAQGNDWACSRKKN